MKKFSKVLDGFGFGSDESAAGSPSATNTGSSQVSVSKWLMSFEGSSVPVVVV